MKLLKQIHHIPIIGLLVFGMMGGFLSINAMSDILPELTFELSEFEKITAFAISPGNEQIFIGGYKKDNEGTISDWYYRGFLFSLISGEKTLEFTQHKGYIGGAVFSSDGEKILTSGVPYTAFLWDAKTGQVLQTFKTNAQTDQYNYGYVSGVAFLSDDTQIALGDHRGNFHVFDISTGDELNYLPWYKSVGSIGNITIFNKETRAIVSNTTGGSTFVVALENDKSVTVLYPLGVGKAVLSEDKKYVITVESFLTKGPVSYFAYRDIETGEFVKKSKYINAFTIYALSSNAEFAIARHKNVTDKDDQYMFVSSSTRKVLDDFSSDKSVVFDDPYAFQIVSDDTKAVIVKDNVLQIFDISDLTSTAETGEELN